MNKLSSILLASSLLFLPACGGGTDTTTQVENNTPVPKPESTNNETFPENATQQTKPLPTTVSGLIPSTNPDERLKQVEQGKNNPFSSIRPPSVVKVTSTTPPNVSSIRDKAIAKVNPTSTSAGNSATNNNQVAILKTNGDSNVIDIENQLESAPIIEIPSPSDAQGVLVSGILDLQGENVALIKTPWDTVPRSVRVGDIISDATGSINVRVKEISFKESSSGNVALIDNSQTFFRNLGSPNGIVVLEQYGQLVTKEVNQQGSNGEQVEEL